MPTVALGCCCGGETGITLCVQWSACFAYVDNSLTILYERDGGESIEHIITGAEGESIAYGSDCIDLPSVGTWTVSISGACLDTVSGINVAVTPGSSPVVLLALHNKFSTGLVYSDDNGSATISSGADAGEACSWRGGYLYYESNGIAPITCGTEPFDYIDYVFDGIADVHVEVLVRFVGFWGTVAKFEVQKTTSAWTASGYTCDDGSLGDFYCKPANNDPKTPSGGGPFRMWCTTNNDAADSAGCEEVNIGGTLTFADGDPPVWLEGIVTCGIGLCDTDGNTIAICVNSPDGFDVTYTVTT